MKLKLFNLLLMATFLTACASTENEKLMQAKAYFQKEHYDQAMFQALPLAKNGNSEAQYVVGYMYYYGLGTIENPSKAQYWINKSAQQGNLNAIHALENEAKPHGSL